MSGKDRFQSESPNSIDAGEAPPFRPARRGRRGEFGNSTTLELAEGTRSPRSVVRTEDFVSQKPAERLFRGTKFNSKTEHDDDDLENPRRRCSISTSGSFEEGSMLEFYEGDELSERSNVQQYDQQPSPDEARMYAAAVLNGSFRRDSDSDDDTAAWAAEALASHEAKPLSSSAVRWRRPSRRQNARKPCCFLANTYLCILFLVVLAIASLVLSASKGKTNVAATYFGANVVDNEMVQSPRFLKIMNWLSENNISTIQSLTTADSPQYEAARWLADTDKLQLDIPNQDHAGEDQGPSAEPHERVLQRYILALFYYSLGGPHWKQDLSFLSETHECAWYQTEVTNEGEGFAVGVTCNGKLSVVDLFIPGNNLKGVIPSEIQHLQHLELLSLRNNYVSNIPSELARLSSTLEYLDFSKNNVAMTIPTFLGSLQKLKVLGLAENALSGTVPTQLTHLYNLETLDLSYNQMHGGVGTVIGLLVRLQNLFLQDNHFSDTLDDSFLINLRSLKELALHDNMFQSVGQLPFHLISHPNITHLDLSSNLLSGSLPKTFLSSSNSHNYLKFLRLAGNNLSGTIPDSLQMLSNLEYLDLQNNEFTGDIPASLGNLKKLTQCYMGLNAFRPANIPPFFFTDTILQVLSLPHSQLTGQIPPWFGLLSTLTYLDLSHNELTGSIPVELWEMPALNTLLLASNQLMATLPASIPESQLEILDLGDNQGITGDATGICSNSKLLATFAFEGLCDKIHCTDPFCCHTECCTATASEQCFSVLISSSLKSKNEELYRDYQGNRTIASFSPSIIRHQHFEPL